MSQIVQTILRVDIGLELQVLITAALLPVPCLCLWSYGESFMVCCQRNRKCRHGFLHDTQAPHQSGHLQLYHLFVRHPWGAVVKGTLRSGGLLNSVVDAYLLGKSNNQMGNSTLTCGLYSHLFG